MPLLEPIAALNKELLKMTDFTFPLWNSGARWWLEHRGPALARAIAQAPGLKLWLSAPPLTNLHPILKTSVLFADHVVVGHCGPLPPSHLMMLFPWRVDDKTEIPEPIEDTIRRTGKHPLYLLIADRVCRPLPPVSRQCLLGKLRQPMTLGMVSYFPVSVIYAPLSQQPWPSPLELLSRSGTLPSKIPALGVKYETAEVRKKWERENQEKYRWEVGDEGYPEFTNRDVQSLLWEWSDAAVRWELLFAKFVGAGGLEAPRNAYVQLARLPDAVLKLRLPTVLNAEWDLIMEMKEREQDSLHAFRKRVLDACSKIYAAHGTRRFTNEVEHIQQTIIDKGVNELERSFRGIRRRQWFKAAAVGIGAAFVEIACYIGLPEYTQVLARGSIIASAIAMALDIQKEEEEWRRRMKSDNPMYFIWRLRKK